MVVLVRHCYFMMFFLKATAMPNFSTVLCLVLKATYPPHPSLLPLVSNECLYHIYILYIPVFR